MLIVSFLLRKLQQFCIIIWRQKANAKNKS